MSLSAAEKAAALSSCKNAAKTYTTALGSALPSNFAAEIDAICTRIASGNLSGAKQIAQTICQQVATALPAGVEQTAVKNACKHVG